MSVDSNSKSEDTLATCMNCGNKEKITVEGFLPGSNVRVSGCSKCLESDTKVTLSTITGEAPYEFIDEPPQDTSLDEQYVPIDYEELIMALNPHGAERLKIFLKQQQIKLIERIEDEVDKHDPSTGRTTSKAYWGNTLRQALKKLKDNVINGGSL